MGVWQLFFVVLCVAGGAAACIIPFLLEYRLLIKLADTRTLTTVSGQLEKAGELAGQIGTATSQWQDVQQQANNTANLAKQISERMNAEVKAFTDFLERANDSERATLRLEVEKLKRGENEWLQVLVRIMDHVHALHLGAVRSGQVRVIEQITNFQSACRDTARRVGLTPYLPEASEPFDPKRHQLVDVEARPAPNAVITETIATGYTFQGKVLRPALVKVGKQTEANGTAEKSPAPDPQSQLPLEQAASA